MKDMRAIRADLARAMTAFEQDLENLDAAKKAWQAYMLAVKMLHKQQSTNEGES